jgi:hypothetical protein
MTSVLMMSACAYPISTVDQGGQISGVFFPGAPTDLMVSVDGSENTSAAPFDGNKSILKLQSGRHHIILRRSSGEIVYDQDIYIGDGSRIAIRTDIK